MTQWQDLYRVPDTATLIAKLASELPNGIPYHVDNADGSGNPAWYKLVDPDATPVNPPQILQPVNVPTAKLRAMGLAAPGGGGGTPANPDLNKLFYTYSSTVGGTPAPGEFRFDTASPDFAGQILIADVDRNVVDQSANLAKLLDDYQFMIIDPSNQDNFLHMRLDQDMQDQTTHYSANLTVVESGDFTSLTNTNNYDLHFDNEYTVSIIDGAWVWYYVFRSNLLIGTVLPGECSYDNTDLESANNFFTHRQSSWVAGSSPTHNMSGMYGQMRDGATEFQMRWVGLTSGQVFDGAMGSPSDTGNGWQWSYDFTPFNRRLIIPGTQSNALDRKSVV